MAIRGVSLSLSLLFHAPGPPRRPRERVHLRPFPHHLCEWKPYLRTCECQRIKLQDTAPDFSSIFCPVSSLSFPFLLFWLFCLFLFVRFFFYCGAIKEGLPVLTHQSAVTAICRDIEGKESSMKTWSRACPPRERERRVHAPAKAGPFAERGEQTRLMDGDGLARRFSCPVAQ